MKSLLISSIYFPPQVGGISRYMAAVVKSLPPQEICCLTGVPADSEADHEFQDRIYRRPVAFGRKRYWSAVNMARASAEIIIRERPKVLQVATVGDGYLALHLQRWAKLPFVIYAHGNEILHAARIAYPKPKLSLQRAARVLANSRFTAELVGALGVEPDRIVVLHPACDIDRFRPLPNPALLRKQLLGDRWNDRVVLSVGNLVSRKGHDTVTQALPQILQQIPDLVYLIVGDGPYRPTLESLAVEAGVRSRVIFAGRMPNAQLPEIYALADVFVMPSRMDTESCDVEGFGMVFLEASACGKPVVGGASGGIPDAVVDGVTGLLVNPASTEEIASSVIRILRKPETARQFGEEGRKRVLSEFTWSLFAQKLRQILAEVSRERQRGTSSRHNAHSL